jgi:hypothetical protein
MFLPPIRCEIGLGDVLSALIINQRIMDQLASTRALRIRDLANHSRRAFSLGADRVRICFWRFPQIIFGGADKILKAGIDRPVQGGAE